MDEWLTYAQAAERLNLTVEAVRLRALRGRWQKTIGNDKRPRIRLPEGWSNDVQTTPERRERKPRNDGQTTVERAFTSALVTVLEAHNASLKTENERLAAALEALKAELAAANARASEESAAVEAHNATLKADIEKLEAQLAGAEIRASGEAAKTAAAIHAFESLAQRLEAIAEARRPLWHRLLWRA